MRLTKYDLDIIIRKHYTDLISMCGLKHGLKCSKEITKLFIQEKKRRKIIDETTKCMTKFFKDIRTKRKEGV